MAGPIKAQPYTFYVALTSVADTDNFKANPTLAAGDVTVSKDGGPANNITTLPYAFPAAGAAIRVQLSAQEMDGDVIAVRFTDAAGDEWQGLLVTLITETGTLTSLTTAIAALPTAASIATAVWAAVSRTLTTTIPTAADIADAVWDEVLSTGHAVSNSAGKLLYDNIASAASIADAVWDEAINTGHSVANSAGLILYTNLNAAVGSVAADAATAVWGAVSRTLTSGAITAADVWGYVTRTLTSSGAGGATAQEVWEYTSRTLTQTAAQVAAAITGNDLTVTAGVSFAATLTGLTIPSTWTKIYLTAKGSEKEADSAAKAQLVESNPGVGTDGLLYLNGAAGTAAQGSLTVTQAAGTIAIVLTDDATVQFTSRWNGAYDVKCILTDGTSSLLTYGDFTIQLTETKAVS